MRSIRLSPKCSKKCGIDITMVFSGKNKSLRETFHFLSYSLVPYCKSDYHNRRVPNKKLRRSVSANRPPGGARCTRLTEWRACRLTPWLQHRMYSRRKKMEISSLAISRTPRSLLRSVRRKNVERFLGGLRMSQN